MYNDFVQHCWQWWVWQKSIDSKDGLFFKLSNDNIPCCQIHCTRSIAILILCSFPHNNEIPLYKGKTSNPMQIRPQSAPTAQKNQLVGVGLAPLPRRSYLNLRHLPFLGLQQVNTNNKKVIYVTGMDKWHWHVLTFLFNLGNCGGEDRDRTMLIRS